MINTRFRPRRNERGASLIMLVSIIGLAFIVTVAAFLVSASNGQNTARFASAKVDIATREDALTREILQQAAQGMLPGTDGVTGNPLTWTTIMTNAVTELRATTYVDPAELAAIPALSGVIPANMADTGGTPLGLFKGYLNSEVPFGGTSGLANVVSPYNPIVQPPLMAWSANPSLVTATALTTPQEFFLGSQYSSTSSTTYAPVTNLSASNRWGSIAYPNIRFGYKQPGNSFIARRVWWRIPVAYQTTQQTLEDQAGVSRYPSVPANYVLSIYEIPSQLPISGNANLQIGINADNTAWGSGINVTGSISGGLIQLSPGTYSGVSSRQQVNVLSSATVGGLTYSTSTNNLFDQAGTREQIALTQAATQATPGAAPVSVAGDDGKVLLVPVMPGNPFYMSVATPTHWDLYARPYYRCRIRIIISGTDPAIIYSPSNSPQINPTAGAITVNVSYLADTTGQPDQILGFPDSAATAATGSPFSQTSYAAGGLPAFLNYTSTGTGDRNLLVIDVGALLTYLGVNQSQLYSIYIGSNPTTEPAAVFTSSDPGIGITNTNNLSAFTKGLSIVTNQTLYLLDSFNQVNLTGGTLPPPTSIYAPQVRYGISGAIANVSLTGQVSVDPAATPTPGTTPVPANPFSLVNASGTPIPPSSISATFFEITNPNLVPPIPRLSLMFTIEKERTN